MPAHVGEQQPKAPCQGLANELPVERAGSGPTVDQENNRWETEYDDDVVTEKDPYRNRVIRTYDDEGRLIREEDEAGSRREYRSVLNGRVFERQGETREYDE